MGNIITTKRDDIGKLSFNIPTKPTYGVYIHSCIVRVGNYIKAFTDYKLTNRILVKKTV